MEQKHFLLSAFGVGVGLGVGLGLSSGQVVQKWVGGNRESGELSGEQIEQEIMRQVVDGKDTKVTFEEFPYYVEIDFLLKHSTTIQIPVSSST